MIDIIISDEFGSHGEEIRTAISVGYGSDISSRIQIIGYWSPAYQEAVNNSNIIALIRSTSEISSYINDAKAIYPRVQTFFPLSSNNFEQLNIFSEPEPPIIVTSGAGDTEERNNTGYGNGLEFWDTDNHPESTPDDWSSYSNGIVLGKLLKIKDTLGCSWWEARYRARMTADRTEPNRVDSPWDLRNGYGKINVANAIAYTGLIPLDPYLYELQTELINDLQTQITDLTNQNIALQNQITSLQSTITDLNEQITSLQSTIESFNTISNIKGIQTNLVTPLGLTLFAKIADLKIKDDKLMVILDYYYNLESFISGQGKVYRNYHLIDMQAVIDEAYKQLMLTPEFSNSAIYKDGDYTMIKTITDDYIFGFGDNTLNVKATKDITITLLQASLVPGRVFNIVNQSDYVVNIVAATGDLINDSATYILQNKADGVIIQSTGSGYIIIK